MPGTTSAAGQSASLHEWLRFLLLDSHVLGRMPTLLFQEAANQPAGTAPATAALDRLRAGRETRPWLCRLNRPVQGSALLMTVPTGMDLIGAGACSPDGSKIAAGSASSPYRLTFWDALNGRETHSLALEGEVQTCAFSPRGDRVVVTIRGPWGEFYIAKVLDAATGNTVAELHVDSESWQPLSCAFSPDGARVAIGTGTRLERVNIFDAATGQHVAELVMGDREAVGYVPTCAFSRDGRFVAAASPESVKVWTASTFDERFACGGISSDSYASDHPRALAFSSDGRRLRVAYSNGAVRIWDTEAWNELATLNSEGEAYTAAFSVDGRLVACEEKGKLMLWDLEAEGEPARLGQGFPRAFAPDGRLLSSFGSALNLWSTTAGLSKPSGHAGMITATEYSPDGSFLVTASDDETLRVWDAATGAVMAVLAGHRRRVEGFEFSQDGRRLLSRAEDGVIAWEVPSGTLLAKLGPWFGDIVQRGSALTRDGTRAALGCRHHRLELVDPATGQTLLDFGGHSDNARDFVGACRFLAGDRRVLSVGFLHTFKLWDAETGALVASLAPAERHNLIDWAATADGQRLVIEWTHDTLKLWDGFTGGEVAALSLSRALKQVAFSPDSHVLATALHDRTIRLWDARTGAEQASLVESSTRGFVFSPDSRRLLTMEDVGPAALNVWDVATASKVSSFGRESRGLGFSPDGAIVASSRDEWLRFWDATTGAEIACQRLSSGYPQLAWSPDGSIAAVGDWSGELHLLRIENGRRVV